MNIDIFLDEAGDLGVDFENKSPSTHFCITLLVCKNKQATDALKAAVKNTLTRKFNYKKTKNPVLELKGTNTTLEIKKYFYHRLETFKNFPLLDMEIYTIIFDKRAIIKPISLNENHHEFYNFIAKKILDIVDFSDVENEVNLHVDRSKGNKERQLFDTLIQTHLKVKFKIRHEQSHDLAGLQAVDLFCYGILRKYSRSDTSWYNVFSKMIKKEIDWRP